MRDSSQAGAYARAIYDVALAGWLRDLATLRDNLRAEAAERSVLDDSGVDFETRKTLLDRLLPVGAGQDLRNFAYTLLSAGHLGMLDETIAELRRLQRHGPNVIVAHVTTAVPPTDEEKAVLERSLTGRYGPDVDVTWHTDAAILGGVVVRVGDEVIDDSLASRLELLRTSLKGMG